MSYGILVCIDGLDGFQIVGEVASVYEAKELIQNYIAVGPAESWIAPERFEIHRRGTEGGYTTIEQVPF
jgi:hypothetical protein